MRAKVTTIRVIGNQYIRLLLLWAPYHRNGALIYSWGIKGFNKSLFYGVKHEQCGRNESESSLL